MTTSSETETAPSATRGMRGRASWIFADQALSSLSNAALMVVVARTVNPTEYGAFALAFAAYALSVGFVQALPGQILMIRYSARLFSGDLAGSRLATGAALWLGLGAALTTLGVSAFVGGTLRSTLIATALMLPGLLLQEMWRIHFFASGQPRRAFLNDLTWVLLQGAAIASLLLADVRSAWAYVAAWGLAAAGAALLGGFQSRILPQLPGVAKWLGREGDVGWPSLLNSVVTLGSTQVALIGVASVGSLVAVGAMRAAQTLLGPLNIIGFAATAFAVPEISRRPHLTARQYTLAAAAICAPLVLAAATLGSLLVLLPDKWGTWLLGETWTAASDALVGLTLFTIAIGITTGPNAVMRALGRPAMSLIGSLVLAPLLIGLSAIGATAGAGGAALGYAAAAGATIPVTWALLVVAVRRGPSKRRQAAPI